MPNPPFEPVTTVSLLQDTAGNNGDDGGDYGLPL